MICREAKLGNLAVLHFVNSYKNTFISHVTRSPLNIKLSLSMFIFLFLKLFLAVLYVIVSLASGFIAKKLFVIPFTKAK